MKHAKLISETYFDWESAKEAARNAVDNEGNVNWKAASYADPGVSSCPNCKEYFWDEAKIMQCTECGTKFNSHTKEIL